jgi:hypothetical protein
MWAAAPSIATQLSVPRQIEEDRDKRGIGIWKSVDCRHLGGSSVVVHGYGFILPAAPGGVAEKITFSRRTSFMNNPFMLRRIAPRLRVIALLAAAATVFVSGPALAETYLGAALGQGRITASDPALGPNQFNEHDAAFKIVAGSKKGPIGLELAYIDFGKSRGDLGSDRVSGKLNGLAAFAVLPLPDLVPVFDLYGKIGMGRLDTKVTGESLDFSSRGTEFAWGLGAQFRAGSFSVRAEYESFKRDGRNPALLSLGFVKYFGEK